MTPQENHEFNNNINTNTLLFATEPPHTPPIRNDQTPFHTPTTPPFSPLTPDQQQPTNSPPSQPQPQQQETTSQQQRPKRAKRHYEISADISPSNIINHPRIRKQRRLTLYQISHNNKNGIFATFHSTTANAPYITDLPPVPEGFWAVKSHPKAQQFRDAENEEWKQLLQIHTFEIIDISSIPPHVSILPLKWTYAYKPDNNGRVSRYMARLCVRGDLEPRNNQDNRALTLAIRALRAILAFAAYHDYDIHQLDVTNAFPQSHLNSTQHIYCHFPPGKKTPGKVLKLLRALYGLRSSALTWYSKVTSTIVGMGFTQCPDELCVFKNHHLLLVLYVDDLLILGHQIAHIQHFKKQFLAKYNGRDLGETECFLGINITRDRRQRRIYINQPAYIDKIVNKFHLQHGPLTRTPLPSAPLDHYHLQATEDSIKLYQQKIGSLIYAAIASRSDIAFAATRLSMHLLNPGPQHHTAANYVFCHLRDTKSLAITYGGATHKPFFAGSDAAFADLPDHKSTGAYLFSLFGGPIDWRLYKIPTVTLSTTETELISLITAAREICWWRRVLLFIGYEIISGTTIRCDNNQVVQVINNDRSVINSKMRHINIQHSWIRQEVRAGNINVEWIGTNYMPADGLTKALSSGKHRNFIRLIGLEETA